MIGGMYLLLTVLAVVVAACCPPVWRWFRTRQKPLRAFGMLSMAWVVGLIVALAFTTGPQPTPTAATPSTTPTVTASANTRTTTAAPAGKAMVVKRVVDGDTVKLIPAAGGAVVTARLLGIDTPETVDPNEGEGCWGPQASAWAKKLLAGKQVQVRTDPTQDTKDQYGRALVYLTLPDGQDYSVLAAREGMAQYYLYDTPVSEADRIQAAQQQAETAGRGLWGAPCYGDTDPAPSTPPTTQPPVISGDSDGDDHAYVSGPGVNCGIHGCHVHILPHFGWHW